MKLKLPPSYGRVFRSYTIQAFKDNKWQTIATGTTIGYKRVLRIDPIHCSKIRINIKGATNAPALSNFGLYKASPKETI